MRHQTLPRCLLCSESSSLLFVAKDVNRHTTGEDFPYYRCQSCRSVFLWPVPADMGRYYTRDYHPIPASLTDLAAIAGEQRFKLDIVQRFAQGGRLIEIGPSYGAFAYLAKQAGFEVEAIEADEACCRFLNDIVGITATRTTQPARALAETRPARVVALWHVLEHVPDPLDVLRAAVDRLEAGGLLVVATPNPGCLQFRTLGRYWMHLDAPRHLQLIPMGALERQLQPLGLGREYLTTHDPGSLRCRKYSWQTSLMSAFDGKGAKLAMRILGRAARTILAPVERLPHAGVAYTMVCRKGGA